MKWLPLVCMLVACSSGAQTLTLFDLSRPVDVNALPHRGVKLSQHMWGGEGVLRIERASSEEKWPGVNLKAPGKSWDLSQFGYVKVDVRNVGAARGRLSCRVDGPRKDGKTESVTEHVELAPGETQTLQVWLPHGAPKAAGLEFIAMRGVPVAPSKIDTAAVPQLILFTVKGKEQFKFEVTNIRAEGAPACFSRNVPDPFFPMIDEYGQYMHKEWPGKTHSVAEMRARIDEEAKELAAYPGPDNRNKYGGYTAGPRLKATGFFRTQKYNGKWWLVDPEGRLFWSNGIDGVRAQNHTPIDEREHYFAFLPEKGAPFSEFYSRGSWSSKGYYKDKGRYRQYDFTRANLLRKYGEDWEGDFADVSHRRMRSWGINTVANWSDEKIYLKRRTPYVVAVHYGSPDLKASEGMWKKFSDVFDPRFREGVAKRLANEVGKTAGDPWCLGYFIDNELGWGSETSLAVATLQCPPTQKAKMVFVDELKAGYDGIAALNTAWGTAHVSWDALLKSTDAPDEVKARNDLRRFYARTALTYFQTIREEVKRIAPNQLYLGCRFSNKNDIAVRAAARVCDVVSVNRYRYSVAEDSLPQGVDVPMIIGEFHFGALDRGMFHTGLRKARDQEHRAELYAEYLRGALQHPQYVGAHWFIYKDQAATGRGDGENYQIGFVDGCDTPYPEIIAKSREVAATMYELRLEN